MNTFDAIQINDQDLLEQNTAVINKELLKYRNNVNQKKEKTIYCKHFHGYRSVRLCPQCVAIKHTLSQCNLESRLGYILSRFKSRKSSRTMKVNITRDQLVNKWYQHDGRCALTNIQMTYTMRAEDTFRNMTNVCICRNDKACDEIITIDNVELICQAVNVSKYILTINDYISMCSLVVQHNPTCKYNDVISAYC